MSLSSQQSADCTFSFGQCWSSKQTTKDKKNQLDVFAEGSGEIFKNTCSYHLISAHYEPSLPFPISKRQSRGMFPC